MLGVLGNQRVRGLSIREIQENGIRSGVAVIVVCWVSLCSFGLSSIAGVFISGEVSNPLALNPLYPTYDKTSPLTFM